MNGLFAGLAIVCFIVVGQNLAIQPLTEDDMFGALGQAFAFSVFQSIFIGMFLLLGIAFLLLAIFYKRRYG